MHQAPNVLSFRPKTVAGIQFRPRWLRRDLPVAHEAMFYEFLIDGRPLTEALKVAEGIARPDQETTNLGCSMVDAALSQLDQLLDVESLGSDGHLEPDGTPRNPWEARRQEKLRFLWRRVRLRDRHGRESMT